MSSSPWPLPDRIRLPWKIGAAFLRLPTVFVGTRLLKWTQRIQTKNGERLVKAVMEREKGASLLTVCNHLSYIDDGTFYHLLPLRSLFFERKVKWTPSAQEICFKNGLLSAYFSRCHAVPVVRGDGVYQRGVDFLISKLNEGDWVHIYPEGVGRIIAEAKKLPIILPMWMIGSNDILPSEGLLIPRLFKKLTVNIGEPIDLSSVMEQYRNHHSGWISENAVVVRKHITDVIQEKLRELKTCTQELHDSWNCTSKVAYRLL